MWNLVNRKKSNEQSNSDDDSMWTLVNRIKSNERSNSDDNSMPEFMKGYDDFSDNETYNDNDDDDMTKLMKIFEDSSNDETDNDEDDGKLKLLDRYEKSSNDETETDNGNNNDNVVDIKTKQVETNKNDEETHDENKKEEKNKFTFGKLEKWLGDTGASCHVTGNENDLINPTENISQNVIVGDGRKSVVTTSGGLKLLQEGSTKEIAVNDVKVVPKIAKNIISIGLLLRDGGTMKGDGNSISIQYKGTNI